MARFTMAMIAQVIELQAGYGTAGITTAFVFVAAGEAGE